MKAAKPQSYYEHERTEMLPFVPPGEAALVLDIGCSSGGFGGLLKRKLGSVVWGVEPNDKAAAAARERLDKVLNCTVEQMDLGDVRFDGVVCNDVIEHVMDPLALLVAARAALKPAGWLVASIPNLRYLPVLWQLVIHRDFEYEVAGVLDETHVRFFTERSIARLIRRSGFDAPEITGINAPAKWRRHDLLNAMTFGAFSDARFPQFAVVARSSM